MQNSILLQTSYNGHCYSQVNPNFDSCQIVFAQQQKTFKRLFAIMDGNFNVGEIAYTIKAKVR